MKETVSLQKNVLSRENSKHKSPRQERTWCLKELFQAPGLQTSSEGCFLKLIKFIFHNICPFKVYKSVLFSIHTKLFYFFKVMIWFWFWPRWSMGDLLTWNNQKTDKIYETGFQDIRQQATKDSDSWGMGYTTGHLWVPSSLPWALPGCSAERGNPGIKNVIL